MENIFLPNQRIIIILQGLEKYAAGGRECRLKDITYFLPARDFARAKLAENKVRLQPGYKIRGTPTKQRVWHSQTRADCRNRMRCQTSFMQSAIEVRGYVRAERLSDRALVLATLTRAGLDIALGYSRADGIDSPLSE